MTTVAHQGTTQEPLSPGADDLDDDGQTDDEETYVPGPTFAETTPGPAMQHLLDLLKNRGTPPMRPDSNEWRIPCPIHATDRTNTYRVRLQQLPNGAVWVYPPPSPPARQCRCFEGGWRRCSCNDGYCSCSPLQILAALECKDPRIVPAGTIVTDDDLHQLLAAGVRETYGAATWDDGPAEHAEWLDEPLIEQGQFTSIYGPAGIGKSLLAQERAAALSRQGRRVLYLDAENPLSEVKARLQAMGYTAADLARLTYLSFPSLPPLDTPAGAAKLATIVDAIDPQLVILDTWSKFLAGDEASPSTHTAAYNLSILPLRRRGTAVQAIDHSGKDPARGPRGGSSKVDNVDTLWLVTAKTGGRLRLERRKSRTGRGPDLVELVRLTNPLRHERLDLAQADTLSPEVRACIAKLDELEVPAGWGRRAAADELRANAYSVRNETVTAAVNVRRDRGHAPVGSIERSPDLGDHRGPLVGEDPGTSRGPVTR